MKTSKEFSQPISTTVVTNEVRSGNLTNTGIQISANKVFTSLTGIIAILLVFHVLALTLELQMPPDQKIRRVINQFFNFGEEGNFPSFFSAWLLLFAAVICFYIQYAEQKLRSYKQKHWIILAMIFVFLSFDEAVQIHEQSMVVVHYLSPGLPSMLSSAWVIPYAILAAAAGLYFLKFILSLPPRTRNLFVASGFIFVTGALILEMVEAYLNDIYGTRHIYYLIVYSLQELMEMIGVTIFIYALLDYIASYHNEVRLKVFSR